MTLVINQLHICEGFSSCNNTRPSLLSKRKHCLRKSRWHKSTFIIYVFLTWYIAMQCEFSCFINTTSSDLSSCVLFFYSIIQSINGNVFEKEKKTNILINVDESVLSINIPQILIVSFGGRTETLWQTTHDKITKDVLWLFRWEWYQWPEERKKKEIPLWMVKQTYCCRVTEPSASR